jgi:NADPH-dependent 2,4-dienoyl-CoA reductase/sulfur reductase-like enzyme
MADASRVQLGALSAATAPGTTVAAALAQVNATASFRRSISGALRGPLCGMGVCFGCLTDVPPWSNRLTCQSLLHGQPDAAPPSASQRYDVLIVGAGPAGLAAAAEAAPAGERIGLVDDNPAAGGQIWRADLRRPTHPAVRALLARAGRGQMAILGGTRIIAAAGPNELLAESDAGAVLLQFGKLILAAGARELFLPLPGWTLPGVAGAGGLQALVKGGWPIAGKRVIVAGSGPLLLAVAAYLRKAGALIPLIAEQAPAASVNRFARSLWRFPGKLAQGLGLRLALMGIPYRRGCWPAAALGGDRLETVRLVDETGTTTEIPCDYLACGFGLVPNTELAQLLGCQLSNGFVRVDELQRTTVANVFAVGELTGIGGLDKAICEGAVAGAAAVNQAERAAPWLARRRALQGFLNQLNKAFALRAELKSLAQPDTLICRCEDVPLAALRPYASWRAAKLQTRCGMGLCQGRVCGPITQFLFGWPTTSVRPPLFPARLGSLAAADALSKDESP